MPKKKLVSGVIDPISLIGVLLLIVTLVVGTKVTNDRSMSLNISEKAAKLEKTGNAAFDKCREESGREVCNERLGINVNWKGEIVNEIDTSKVDENVTKPGDPTCDANGVQYSPGAVVMYGGIGSNATCGADGKWDVGVGATKDIITENLPEYAKESDKLKKQIEDEQTIAETEKQAEVAVPTTVTVEPEQIGLTQSTNQTSGTTVTQTQVVSQPMISPIQQKEQQPAVTTQVGQPCTNCHLTPTQQTQNSVQLPSQQTVTQVINLMNKDNPVPPTTHYAVINNKLVTGTVKTNPPLRINPLESLKDLGVDLKADITTPDKYAGCTGNACNVTKSLIDDLLINDKYKNYWQEQTAKAKPEDNLLDIAFNQQTVLDTADTVFFDKFTPYVANYQRINAETYDPNRNDVANYLDAYVTGGLDTETRKATVDLGKVITAELATAYALPVIAGSGGLLPAAGATFGQFGAITTSNQIITAGEECIRNGVRDEQCLKDSARAAFSLLTLGSSQAANTITKAAGYSDEAVFLAKGANTILSGGNLAVDSGDVIDTCTKFGSNQSSFGCTMSYIALVADIAGLGADYKHGQLSFGGSKVDIPDINGTRIANAEELALFAKMNSQNTPKVDIPMVEISAAKPVKPADVVAEIDIPKTLDTPSAPKKTFTELFDEKITNPIINSPVGDFLFGKPTISLDNLDTPLPPTVGGNAPVMIKPVEIQAVEIPYSKELDPLIEVRNAWNKYGDRLTTAYNNKDVQGLIDMAKENGYQVKIVPFGEKVDIVEIGGKTTKMPMTKADTVRIGKSGGKKTLFIATTDVSNPTFKIDDLAHDIGAVITDVKFIPIEKIDISPYSFADFMTRATGEKWNASDIAKKFGTQLNGRTKSVEVPITYIVDALTFGEVPSNFLESVPIKTTLPQKFTNWVKAEMAKTNPNAFLNGPVGDFLFGKPTFENAEVSIINYLDNNKIIIGNYSNNGNGKILIVDLNNDPDLRKLIDNSNEYLANVAKDEGLTTSEGLTNFVNDQFSEYNTSKITETVDNVLKQELQLYTDNPEGIVIGQFIKLKCAVCREQSTMLHVLMATNDIDSKIVLINLGNQNHAYVEFIDDVGKEMIADPVLGFVLPKNEALARYSGTTNKQTEIVGEIIVTRPQTPVNTRVATNKNLTITTSTSPLTGFAKFQNDFTNWVKTEMAKTNPNAFKNIGFELRSPISADGKLQLPFEKATTTPQTTQKIEELIDKVDSLVQKDIQGVVPIKNYVPEYGCKAGLCGLSSDYVGIAAPSYGLEPKEFQIQDLNISRGLTAENAFRHAATVVKDTNGDFYLIDDTFIQFVDEKTGAIRQLGWARRDGVTVTTGLTKDNPVAQELLTKGYIKLTPETLGEYLNLTSSGSTQPLKDLDILLIPTSKFTITPADTVEGIVPPELLPTLPQSKSTTIFGYELRSPIGTDGKLQLPFGKAEAVIPISPSPPVTTLTKVQEQAGTVVKNVLDGSFSTGVGFSPLKYVAGGIASAVFLDDYFDWGIIDYIQNNFVSTINHVYSDNEKKTIGVKLDSSKLESIKPEKIIVASQKSEKSVQDIRPSECVNKEILNTAIVGGDTGLRYDSKFKPDVVVINDIINNATYDRWVPAELAPEAVGPVKEWTQWINDQGYSPFISSGYRSYETQEAYSRSYGNQAATPGGSCHQSGLCFDVHFYVDNKTGKRYDLCYDPNLPECLININAQKKAQELGIAHPYEWDQPHYMVAVAASPAILPFVQQQPLNKTYIDTLNEELFKLQNRCDYAEESQFVSNP